MDFADILLLAVAGFASGVVNAVAGGGTFLTFGALSIAGIAPIAANATSSITQFPGYITSTLAYRDDIAPILARRAGPLRHIRRRSARRRADPAGARQSLLPRDGAVAVARGDRAVRRGTLAQAEAQAGQIGDDRRGGRFAGTVPDRGLWRVLRRRHGRDDAGDPWPDPDRRLPPAERDQEPVVDRDRGGRHCRLRFGRRGGLAASAGDGAGGRAGWLLSACGPPSACRKTRCAASSSRSGCFWPAIIS